MFVCLGEFSNDTNYEAYISPVRRKEVSDLNLQDWVNEETHRVMANTYSRQAAGKRRQGAAWKKPHYCTQWGKKGTDMSGGSTP